MANNNTPAWSFQNTTSGSETPSLFGTTSKPNQGSSLFGSASGTNQASNPFAASSNTNQGSNLFGSAAGGGGGTGGSTLFGGSSTPTSKPASGFTFGNASTTPAGPPPSKPLSFGLQSTTQQSQSSAPGSGNTAAPAPASSGSSLFGNMNSKPTSNLFASNQQSTPTNPTSSSQPGTSMFSQASGNSSSNLFGNRPEAQPTAGLFNNLGKQNESKPPTTSATQAEAPKSLFGNIGGQSAASNPFAQTSTPPLFPTATSNAGSDASKPSFSFPPSSSKPAESTTPTTTAPSLFSLGGAQNTSTASAAPATSSTAPSTSLFANLGKPNANTTQAATSTSAASGSSSSTLFSNLSKPAEKPAEASAAKGPSLASAPPLSTNTFSFPPAAPTTADEASSTKAADPTSATAGKSNLGTSTSGPAPAAQSRLKNKSMDEIITRWASDLSKYQKEFQRQAETVAAWDRMLVENSDKIQKLYGSTLEAQRATSEVERQLTLVENEQADIERDLDAYERQVDEMIAAQQGLGESYQGSDGERQRMYDLADKVNGRLDEMGKDLGSMIEEINDASSSLNKNNKPDDPLSQVVRVLNSHLTQLQEIDQGAAALQLKVAAAQKANMSMGSANGYVGPASDAADGFYRSFMGRR